MRVTLWGTRGSLATPGPETIRYGGNTYSAMEYSRRVGWGHSAVSHAVGFAAAAEVKRLVTFHHDPGHDDAALDRLIDEARSSVKVSFELIPGTEGARFDLGPRSRPSDATA